MVISDGSPARGSLAGKTVFLTGLTGSLGSFLAREALRHGMRVVAIVRAAEPEIARQRAADALRVVGADVPNGRVEVICGDVCLDDLGIADAGGRLGQVDLVVHSAARVDFDPAAAPRSRRTNVDGTRNMLALAARLGVRLVHVSTAYVAGRREGVAREDEIDVAQEFNNVYEETKCHAELLVRDWSARTNLAATVLRPGIVLGDSRRGRIIHFNTVYDGMHALELIARRIGKGDIRVAAGAAVRKNIVPVDYFARAAWHIVAAGAVGTYHLTHPEPITMAELGDVLMGLYGLGRIHLVDEAEFRGRVRTPAERILRNALAAYEPYMTAEPMFDRSAADAVLAGSDIQPGALDEAYFSRLIDYARSVRWGRSKRETATTPRSDSRVRRYFDEFLKAKLGRLLVPNLRSLTASFRIRLTDADVPVWSLRIDQGVLASIATGDRNGQCGFVVDTDTFLHVVAARLAPQQAFFQKRAEIEGDIETGLHLVAALAEFFARFPYDGGEGE